MKRSLARKAVPMITLFVALAAGALAASAADHIMVVPADVKWADGPASLPAGSKVAVIEGDPKNPALFTMRLKFPAGYKIPPHWHPADEHVTVLSGTFSMGMGDAFDASKATALTEGSFAVMPAKSTHFAFTNGEVVVQVHGMGPWGITYVNAADDPRKR